jgi:hypothetical protein
VALRLEAERKRHLSNLQPQAPQSNLKPAPIESQFAAFQNDLARNAEQQRKRDWFRNWESEVDTLIEQNGGQTFKLWE